MAMSLMLGTSVATGSAILTSFLPTDVAGLTHWYKADSGVYIDAGTTPAANTEVVEQWNDHSGNGNHATQTTAANKPTYRTNVKNGKPTLRFDGSNDEFVIPTTGAMSAMTIFAVCEFNAGFSDLLLAGAAAGSNYTLALLDATPNLYHSGTGRDTGGYTADTWTIFAVNQTDATAATLYRDGAALGTAFNPTDSLTFTRIGNYETGGFAFGGDIGEILIYNASLSAGDMQDIEDYLGLKWGITVT